MGENFLKQLRRMETQVLRLQQTVKSQNATLCKCIPICQAVLLLSASEPQFSPHEVMRSELWLALIEEHEHI